MTGRSGNVAVARYRLVRAGYRVSFELAAGKLWCPACGVSLAPERCSVDESIVVGRLDGHAVRLAAIRTESPLLRGTWLVGPTEDESRFMDDLVRRGLERSTARVGASGPWAGVGAPSAPSAPDGAVAGAPHQAGGARRSVRVLTVTW